MSREAEDEIDYDLNYDVDDIELDLMYQDEISEEEAKKSASDFPDYLDQPQSSSSTVSKPYFQPRQVRNKGRGSGGRVAHRLGDRKPSQESQDRQISRQNRSVVDDVSRGRGCKEETRRTGKSPSKESLSAKEISANKAISELEAFTRNSNPRDSSLSNKELSLSQDDLVSHLRNEVETHNRSRPAFKGSNNKTDNFNRKKRSPSPNRKSTKDISRNEEKQSKGQSINRNNRSRSRGRRSKSLERKQKNRDRSGSRERRSTSRERQNKARHRRSRSRNRRSLSRGPPPMDRFRRGLPTRRSRSRGRRSRSRELRKRSGSRSRELRSRSRERRYSRGRRSRSSSIKRTRRLSHSSSRSRSRERRRRRRSYSRSKSSSPDVIAYKSKVELIDLDSYKEERRMPSLDPNSHYGGNILQTPAYAGQPPIAQFRQSPPPFQNSFQVPPPPPGTEPYSQDVFSQGQPPPAPYISNPTPPAPFISGQTPPAPNPAIPGAPPHFPPPSHVTGMPPQHNQFSLMAPSQTEEFSGFSQNVNIGSNRFGNFEGAPSEHFQTGLGQQPFPAPPKEYGAPQNWTTTANPHPSPVLIYASNSSNQVQASRAAPVKKSGVEEERQNQKQTLVQQLEQYLQKNASLQKELSRLKDQRDELLIIESSDTERLLKENTKLQNEITQRLKAIENVIEMLTGLIKKDHPEEKDKMFSDSSHKDYRKDSPPHHSQDMRSYYEDDMRRKTDRDDVKQLDKESLKRNKSPSRRGDRKSPGAIRSNKDREDVVVIETSPPPLVFPKFSRERSPPRSKQISSLSKSSDSNEPHEILKSDTPLTQTASPVNLVHYDPELHWCSLCNVFPKTAVDYLNHLHTSNHKQQVMVLKLDVNPWHADEPAEEVAPVIKNAPSKRIPIRGVQFLVPTTGWYCRLCKSWIGDMHCAQEHLKGHKHTTNYSEYIAQNPHWEVDWLSDRTKSFERSSEYLSRLRDKNESLEPALNEDLQSERAKFSALSDKLLAVLMTQQNKRQRQVSSSSSSSSTSEDERKKQKKSKKKKSKKKKKKDDDSPEKTSKTKTSEKSPAGANNRQKNIEAESCSKSDMISSWMEDKTEPAISIKLKQRVKQGPNKNADNRPQGDKYKGFSSNKNERYKEGKPDGKNARDNHRSRGYRRGFGNRWDQRRRDVRNNREDKDKDQKEESVTNNVEQQKKNLLDQRVEEPPIIEKKKSPLRVFQRPDDPLDRDSPEPVVFQEKNKFTKNDKPQGKLWFPPKETEIETDSVIKETEGANSPKVFEKQPDEMVAKKKIELKKPTQFSLPKTKLPFIGRMPILKKKTIDFKTEEGTKDKPEKTLIWPNIPDAQEGPQQDPAKINVEESTAPSLPFEAVKASSHPNFRAEDHKATEDNLAEEDMDIANDDQDDVIWVGDVEKTELHQDFQDTLDLLFPEGDVKPKGCEQKKDESNNYMDKGTIYGPALPPSNEQPLKKVYGCEMPPPGYVGGPDFNASVPPPIGPPAENLGQMGPALAPSFNEDHSMINLGVPPEMIPRGPPPVRNEGPPMLHPMGPPPPLHGNPLMNDPLMSRPPHPLGAGGPPPFMGPGPRLPMRPGVPPPPPPLSLRPPHLRPAAENLMMGGPPMGPPQPMVNSLYPPEEEFEEGPVQRRKNAPSQRMRRHMQKKRAEAEAKAKASSPPPPSPVEDKKSKYEGMDQSDLAMLGIDEDDSIIFK